MPHCTLWIMAAYSSRGLISPRRKTGRQRILCSLDACGICNIDKHLTSSEYKKRLVKSFRLHKKHHLQTPNDTRSARTVTGREKGDRYLVNSDTMTMRRADESYPTGPNPTTTRSPSPVKKAEKENGSAKANTTKKRTSKKVAKPIVPSTRVLRSAQGGQMVCRAA